MTHPLNVVFLDNFAPMSVAPNFPTVTIDVFENAVGRAKPVKITPLVDYGHRVRRVDDYVVRPMPYR